MDKYDNIDFFKDKNKKYIFDELTDTLNKSTILGYIGSLVKSTEPFTIFFMDLDYFKTINDTYGHNIGDLVLKQSAYAISLCLNDKQVVGRFGGDEFIVVARGMTEYQDKWDLGRKICLAVSGLKIDFGPTHIGQTLTVSIGISTFPNDANTFNNLIERADKALYRGKQKGRNCFVIFNKEAHENIMVNNEASSHELSKMITYIYDEMTSIYSDLNQKLVKISSYLGITFGIDAISILLNDKFDILYSDNELKLSPIPIEIYEKVGFKDSDVLAINLRMHFEETCNELFKMMEEQDVNASVILRIHTNNNEYGYIRIDKYRENIWTPTVKVVFQTLARLIAIMLENKLYI